jgi:hypothetical protein
LEFAQGVRRRAPRLNAFPAYKTNGENRNGSQRQDREGARLTIPETLLATADEVIQ